MRRLAVISLLAGAVLAGPALACSPALLTPGERTRSAECADTYSDDEITSRGVGNATDLGGGFVSQFYVEGNACYGNASMIVVDCNSGRAAVFGPGGTVGAGTMGDAQAEAANRPFAALRKAVEDAAAAGRPISVEEIVARARGRFTNAAAVEVKNLIGISNTEARPIHSFDLSCGCALYYSGSAGAKR